MESNLKTTLKHYTKLLTHHVINLYSFVLYIFSLTSSLRSGRNVRGKKALPTRGVGLRHVQDENPSNHTRQKEKTAHRQYCFLNLHSNQG